MISSFSDPAVPPVVVLFFDGDPAGREASWKALLKALRSVPKTFLLRETDGKLSVYQSHPALEIRVALAMPDRDPGEMGPFFGFAVAHALGVEDFAVCYLAERYRQSPGLDSAAEAAQFAAEFSADPDRFLKRFVAAV